MSQYLHSLNGPFFGSFTWTKNMTHSPRTSPSDCAFLMVQVAYDVEISPQHPPKAVVEEAASRDGRNSQRYIEFI